MDRRAITTRSDLERMLSDESAEPKALTLAILEGITNGFSDEQEIGRGGFAVVYKGFLGNRMVAVKRLSESHMHEKEFHREVECLMKVKHKNVVRFLGYCADTQGSVERYNGKFVMADVQQRLLCFEYLPNGSLQDHITGVSGGFEWRRRYKIINGICEGLHHLHQNHIVHLDLKPANILLDDNMLPNIADFGLSRCFDEKQSRTIATKLVGSMGYLAPEFYSGQITYKLDIYSLGFIMIDILTGEKGYPDIQNVLESWRNRLEGEEQLEQVRVCTEIALECIDSNPQKRPTVEHILNRLNQIGSIDWSVETSVPDKPGSSFSEAAEYDLLPSIDGLQITGGSFPGQELQASGYSINGTTNCNFQWVRHLEDGSVKFIDGARQPTYLVTADDVDTLLAIEVQPLDDKERKGDIVKVYANEQMKITCDPETKEHIKKTLEIGHVSYEVQLPAVRFLDMWEPAVLAIKREGYSIKYNAQRGVVLKEKFQPATAINIPYGRPTEFSITSADRVHYDLMPAENTLPRDTIVLVLRLFRSMAVEKRGRRKGIFFE